MMKMNRRTFIKTTSATTTGIVVLPEILANVTMAKGQANPICVFTKCLQFLDYHAIGEVLAEAGFDGADLAVRNGGQVLPENVKVDLPKAIKAIQKSGISVPMMVTGITNADDPMTENVLGIAAENGIRFYRMGYLRYEKELSVPENLDIHKKTLEKLERLNRKFGIHGGYQNHSGTNVGGPVWDLYWLLKDSDPEYIGVQYDIRHAVAEGGIAWPLGMKLLAPWTKTTAIKDFYWRKEQDRWRLHNVPLGDGMVDYDAYLQNYISLGISGPVSIHYEYDLGGAERGNKSTSMPLTEIKNYMKKDLVYLKNQFTKYQI
jgi:L-ribulose-5-phosphate 3-epimerase